MPPIAGGFTGVAITLDTNYPVLHSGQIGSFAWRGGRSSIPLVSLLETVSADIHGLRRKTLLLNPTHRSNNGLLAFYPIVDLMAIKMQSLRTRLSARN